MKVYKIFFLFLCFFSFGLSVSAYDQVFPTVKLRHGYGYNFTDTFNNGTNTNVWVSDFDTLFREDANYNAGANPTFPYSSEIENNRLLTPGQSRLLGRSTPRYDIRHHPVERRDNNLEIIYTTEHYELRNGSWQGPFTHTEYQPYMITWCGDGVVDNYTDPTGFQVSEVCDPADPSQTGWGNGGCSASCEPITVPTPPSCTAIDVNPVSGNASTIVNMSCSGVNATSYRIDIRDGANVLQSFDSNLASYTFQNAGNYTVQCYINDTITSSACAQDVSIDPAGDPVYDLALQKTVLNPQVSYNIGDSVTFSIRVTNQGDIPVNTFTLSDYIPVGLTLNDTNWTLSGNTATHVVNRNMNQNDEHVVNISFTINANATANMINYAEISVDDGDDCDSTPDNTNGNQTGETIATGMIDDDIGTGCNPGGDEDDHDFASITVNGTTPTGPEISIDKLDANPNDQDTNIGNDTQTVSIGEEAVFRIRVTNTGIENLTNIVLSDAIAPNCAGNVTLPGTYPSTWSNFSTTATSAVFEPGQTFEYTCSRANTQGDYTNSATVDADGSDSGTPVTDTDTTIVDTPGGGGGGGSTLSCTGISKTTNVDTGNTTVRCEGNSQTDSFYLNCGGTRMSPVNAFISAGQKYAEFNCNAEAVQCYVDDDRVPNSGISAWFDRQSWRTGSACREAGTPLCGDGIVQTGEQCDAGSVNGTSGSPCSLSCRIDGGGSNPGSNVLTWPNGGELRFGPQGTKIIGHNTNPLENGESPFLYNHSDYDLSYDQFCIKITTTDNIGAQSALTGGNNTGNIGEYCVDIADDMIYAYERINFMEDFSLFPDYKGNKEGVPVGQSYGNATLTTSLKDRDINGNLVSYYNAYFAADLDIRVAKPVIKTTGGGTSFITKAGTTADASVITDGSDENFVGTSLGEHGISSQAQEVTDTGAIEQEEERADIYEASIQEAVVGKDSSLSSIPVSGYSHFLPYNGLSSVNYVSGRTVNIDGVDPHLNTSTTYIIEDADLIIRDDITTNENIAYVVKGGNIIIESDVEHLSGTYIAIPKGGAGGKIISESSNKRLVVEGSLYGNIDELVNNRYKIEEASGSIGVGTVVSFGSRIFQKPAPLLSEFIGEYLDAERIAR